MGSANRSVPRNVPRGTILDGSRCGNLSGGYVASSSGWFEITFPGIWVVCPWLENWFAGHNRNVISGIAYEFLRGEGMEKPPPGGVSRSQTNSIGIYYLRAFSRMPRIWWPAWSRVLRDGLVQPVSIMPEWGIIVGKAAGRFVELERLFFALCANGWGVVVSHPACDKAVGWMEHQTLCPKAERLNRGQSKLPNARLLHPSLNHGEMVGQRTSGGNGWLPAAGLGLWEPRSQNRDIGHPHLLSVSLGQPAGRIQG